MERSRLVITLLVVGLLLVPIVSALAIDEPAATGAQSGAVGQSAVGIAAGGFHTCAVLSGGSVRCWGSNAGGQLGDGTTTDRTTPTPVIGITNAVAVAAGWGFTCALLSDGGIKCWGRNYYGYLGDGTTTDRLTPVRVSGIADGVGLAAGGGHSCARLSGGTVKCWGENDKGTLGDGTTTARLAPVSVADITNAINIGAGEHHTCAALADGTTRCWGYNGYRQIAGPALEPEIVSTPFPVPGITDAIGLTGGVTHTCALLVAGDIKCWGFNPYGQFGDGTSENDFVDRPPPAVSGITNAISIAAGAHHTCAILSDGAAKCWGYNYFGPVGDGTTTNRLTPVSVSGITNALSVTAGKLDHTCATLSDGGAKCWGRNFEGELGDCSIGSYRTTPVRVVGLPTTPPGAPRNLAASGLDVGGGSLSWTAPVSSLCSPVTYAVYRSPTGSTLFDLIADAGTSLTYRDSAVSTGLWTYRVTASNMDGESPPSNAVTAIIVGLPQTTPIAPQDLAVGPGAEPGSVRLTWRAPQQGLSDAPISHYNIYRSGALVTSVTSALAQTTFEWSDPTSVSGQQYSYSASAVSTTGSESTRTRAVEFTA